jgi:hypothetical protein
MWVAGQQQLPKNPIVFSINQKIIVIARLSKIRFGLMSIYVLLNYGTVRSL